MCCYIVGFAVVFNFVCAFENFVGFILKFVYFVIAEICFGLIWFGGFLLGLWASTWCLCC